MAANRNFRPTIDDFVRIRNEARRTRMRHIWEGRRMAAVDIEDWLDLLPDVPQFTLRFERGREVSREAAWVLLNLDTLNRSGNDDRDGAQNRSRHSDCHSVTALTATSRSAAAPVGSRATLAPVGSRATTTRRQRHHRQRRRRISLTATTSRT